MQFTFFVCINIQDKKILFIFVSLDFISCNIISQHFHFKYLEFSYLQQKIDLHYLHAGLTTYYITWTYIIHASDL